MATAAGPGAREALIRIVSSGPISCRDTAERSYDRVVAICREASGSDLAEAMVSAGWATDIPRFSGGRYQLSEWRARRARVGMFAR
jgi:endonuclease YncB( thermonuclease family)